MPDDPAARRFLEIAMIIFVVLVVSVEVRGVVTKGPTISGISRVVNAKSGGLLALVLAAIWCHMFLPQLMPKEWTSKKAAIDFNCDHV
jgi:hypothetical protein